MTKIQHTIVVAALVLSLTGGAAADAALDAYAGMNPRVAAGEIVASRQAHPRSGVSWGQAVGIIDAPMARVLEVVQDYANYRQFMPNFTQSKVLARRGDKALVYVEAEIARSTLTIWAQMKMTPRATADGGRVIQGKMTKGNLSTMEAVWELTPIDSKRTLVTFKIIVDPKLPLPSSLVSNENEKASRRGLRALRKQLTQRLASGS